MITQTIVDYKGIRVLTTLQVADAYETTTNKLKINFNNNKDKYKSGKHYILLTGEDLKEFKKNNNVYNEVKNSYLVGNRASTLYLWTERGALLHAKSLNTDKAWQVYEYLVENYFRSKEHVPQLPQTHHEEAQQMFNFVNNAGRQKPIKQLKKQVVDVLENPKILSKIDKLQEDLTCMKVLLNSCKMYISEEQYNSKMEAIQDVIGIILKDHGMLTELKPNLIQKVY